MSKDEGRRRGESPPPPRSLAVPQSQKNRRRRSAQLVVSLGAGFSGAHSYDPQPSFLRKRYGLPNSSEDELSSDLMEDFESSSGYEEDPSSDGDESVALFNSFDAISSAQSPQPNHIPPSSHPAPTTQSQIQTQSQGQVPRPHRKPPSPTDPLGGFPAKQPKKHPQQKNYRRHQAPETGAVPRREQSPPRSRSVRSDQRPDSFRYKAKMRKRWNPEQSEILRDELQPHRSGAHDNRRGGREGHRGREGHGAKEGRREEEREFRRSAAPKSSASPPLADPFTSEYAAGSVSESSVAASLPNNSTKGGSPPVETPFSHTSKQFPSMLVYGVVFPLDEDHRTEFKAVAVSLNPIETISRYAIKYINAFLNSSGGQTLYGIADNGKILGIPLQRKDRDLLRLRIDAVVSGYSPQVDPNLVSVSFIPVEVRGAESRKVFERDHRDRFAADVEKRYVCRVVVQKGIASVYLTRSGAAWIRRSGSTYPMDQSMIDERSGHCSSSSSSSSSIQLPPSGQPLNLVGRAEEIDQIRGYAMQHRRLCIVVMWGSALVGKSAVAKHVIQSLHDLYPDRRMIIDLKGITTPYVGCAEARLSVIRQVHPFKTMPQTEAEVLGVYESCFADKNCILLIENVGLAQQALELVPVSAESVLVLVTTRHELMLDAITECLCLKIEPLSLPRSMELFASLVGEAFIREHPAEEVQQLVSGCQGRALFIRMIAASIAKSPDTFQQLLNQMRNREDKYELFARTLPFDPLDADLLESYLPLGVFRDSFSEDAARAVWGPGGPFPSRLPEETSASATLRDLLKAALLVRILPDRYALPDLLQVHCYRFSKATAAPQLAVWRQRFIDHYLSVLLRLKYLHFEYASQEASEIFVQERKNFETAIDYVRIVGPPELAKRITCTVEWIVKHSLSPVEQQEWTPRLHPAESSAATIRRSTSDPKLKTTPGIIPSASSTEGQGQATLVNMNKEASKLDLAINRRSPSSHFPSVAFLSPDEVIESPSSPPLHPTAPALAPIITISIPSTTPEPLPSSPR